MRYECVFSNAAGEDRAVTIELAPHEVADIRHHEKRWLEKQTGPGGEPNGPLAISYAWNRAKPKVPADFRDEQPRIIRFLGAVVLQFRH